MKPGSGSVSVASNNLIKMLPLRVIVGLSGGVDSAVAARLLQQQGYNVEGLFMKNWEDDDAAGYCAAAEDLAAARSVAAQLHIPLHTVNFAAAYWQRVFRPCLDEYAAGRTPNPDTRCNQEIKFKDCLYHALTQLSADYFATGHYARLGGSEGAWRLLRCADPNKDQTYFLYTLGQAQLARTLFPLAQFTKPQVRALAEQFGLPNHARKDSTGLCFIGERKFRPFLQRYLHAPPGPILTLDGVQVGEHLGLSYYTLGQRQGLNIGGRKGQAEAPWYVAAKDAARNALLVVQGHDHPALATTRCTFSQATWVYQGAALATTSAQIRHRQVPQPCQLTYTSAGFRVEFTDPQRAVTPGQAIVFYADDICLGGGIID
jgi:tRNA-specific 2-thiouridylase